MFALLRIPRHHVVYCLDCAKLPDDLADHGIGPAEKTLNDMALASCSENPLSEQRVQGSDGQLQGPQLGPRPAALCR